MSSGGALMLAMDLADLGCIADLYCCKVESTKWLKLKTEPRDLNKPKADMDFFSFGICHCGWLKFFTRVLGQDTLKLSCMWVSIVYLDSLCLCWKSLVS